MKQVFAILVAGCLALPVFADEDAVAEAITDYMGFATYEAGIILPAQLDRDVFEAAVFVDTRDREQFEAGHIPGAVHIEWREVRGGLRTCPRAGLWCFIAIPGLCRRRRPLPRV